MCRLLPHFTKRRFHFFSWAEFFNLLVFSIIPTVYIVEAYILFSASILLTMNNKNTTPYKIRVGAYDMDEIESVGYYRWPSYSSIRNLKGHKNMYGATRVLILLIGVFVLPATLIIVPLYLKYRVFADFHVSVTAFEVLKITDGISPIFCEGHSLRMENNSTFNAFQISNNIKMNNTKEKEIRLRKKISLVGDDVVQYWGYFLNKGTVVNVTLCSRYSGARIMIIKSIKEFRMCGLMDRMKQHLRSNDKIQLASEMNIKINSGKSAQKVDRPLSTRVAKSIEVKNGQGSSDNHSYESSFEKLLNACHEASILINKPSPTSHYCTSLQYLERKSDTTKIEHYAPEDGYYFYIVFSNTENEMQIVLDISKPTYEFRDYTRRCLNKSSCSFPLYFFSREEVVIETLIRDEIGYDIDDTSVLVSSCQPRTFIYVLFAAMVLLLILLFASV